MQYLCWACHSWAGSCFRTGDWKYYVVVGGAFYVIMTLIIDGILNIIVAKGCSPFFFDKRQDLRYELNVVWNKLILDLTCEFVED